MQNNAFALRGMLEEALEKDGLVQCFEGEISGFKDYIIPFAIGVQEQNLPKASRDEFEGFIYMGQETLGQPLIWGQKINGYVASKYFQFKVTEETAESSSGALYFGGSLLGISDMDTLFQNHLSMTMSGLAINNSNKSGREREFEGTFNLGMNTANLQKIGNVFMKSVPIEVLDCLL